jgi:hypothetical protein
MNVLSLIEDITKEKTGGPGENTRKIRPDSPRIRPDETHIKQGNSPHSPRSPRQGVDMQNQVPQASAPDWYDDMISMAIEQLNDAGCQYMAAAEEDRVRARALEMEYTLAANNGDSPRFWRALSSWKRTWIRELH